MPMMALVLPLPGGPCAMVGRIGRFPFFILYFFEVCPHNLCGGQRGERKEKEGKGSGWAA